MNPYQTLGVLKGADKDAIRAAYRRKARKAHPDRAGGSTQAVKGIERALELLADFSWEADKRPASTWASEFVVWGAVK